MSAIDAVEIILDKPRKLLINHRALRRAEGEVNRQRFANPRDYASIDGLMVEAFNNVYRASGMLPMDLLTCMLWAGLLHDDPKLTIDKVDDLLDSAPISRAEISGKVWGAYFTVAGKNLKVSNEATSDGEKKTSDQQTGSDSGPSGDTTLN